MGPDKDGSVTNRHEAAIVPGKAFFLLSSLSAQTLILIETSDGSESESAAWTGGRYVTKKNAQAGTEK